MEKKSPTSSQHSLAREISKSQSMKLTFLLLCVLLSGINSIRLDFKKYLIKSGSRIAQRNTLTTLSTVEELRKLDDNSLLPSVLVTSNVSTVSLNHPTMRLIRARLIQHSKPGQRNSNDTEKVALCIEGGGMRGCVSAGSAFTMSYLGLNDVVDVVYGSSAGAMIGTYFVSRQYSGTKIYYDVLPQAGSGFLDKSKLLESAGIPTEVLHNAKRFRSFMATNTVDKVWMRTINSLKRNITPDTKSAFITNTTSTNSSSGIIPNDAVINLQFLLNKVMGDVGSLDWNSFVHNERLQPMHIVASCIKDFEPVVLTRTAGNFYDVETLLNCIRASMLVPGVTESLLLMQNISSSPVSIPAKPKTSISMNPSLQQLQGPVLSKSADTKINNLLNSTNERFDDNLSVDDQSDILLSTSDSRKTKVEAKRTIRLLQDWISRKTSSRLPSMRPQLSNIARYRNMMNISWRWRILRRNDTKSIDTEEQVRWTPKSVHEKYQQQKQNISSVFPFTLKYSSPGSSTRLSNLKHSSDSPTKYSHHSNTTDTKSVLQIDHEKALFFPNASACLCDAFLCEPIPYRSAVRQGANHCVVLRTRPDPCRVLGKGPGPYEQVIARRFFNQYNATGAINWMMNLEHQRIYAEDVLLMNKAALGPEDGVLFEDSKVHLLPIAVVNKNETEIGQLESRREKIYEGLRSGGRRVLEVFLPMLLTLEELPASMSPALKERIMELRKRKSAGTSESKPVIAEEQLSVEDVMEMVFPISAMQGPPPPLQSILQELSVAKGSYIATSDIIDNPTV